MKKIIILIILNFIYINIGYSNFKNNCYISDSRTSIYNETQKEWLNKLSNLGYCKEKQGVINIFDDYNTKYIGIKYEKNFLYFIDIYKNNSKIFSKEIKNGVVNGNISLDKENYYFILRGSDKISLNNDYGIYINGKKISNNFNEFLFYENLAFYFNKLHFLDKNGNKIIYDFNISKKQKDNIDNYIKNFIY